MLSFSSPTRRTPSARRRTATTTRHLYKKLLSYFAQAPTPSSALTYNSLDVKANELAGFKKLGSLKAAADGSAVEIESLIGSDFHDILIGDDGDNTLTGGRGNDFLYGGDGADSFIGGEGIDVIHGGGAGMDTD